MPFGSPLGTPLYFAPPLLPHTAVLRTPRNPMGYVFPFGSIANHRSTPEEKICPQIWHVSLV